MKISLQARMSSCSATGNTPALSTPAGKVVDNRPTALLQRRLQQAISSSPRQVGTTATVQRVANLTSAGSKVIQRVSEEVVSYIQAYHQARLYHGTSYVDGVKATGLETKYGGTGLNGAPYRENRVFIAEDADTSESYASSTPENIARVFLEPARTRCNEESRRINRNITLIPDQYKGELFRDPENPCAFFTERDIPADQLFFGDMEQLLSSANADTILNIIGQYMGEGRPSLERLKALHLEAIAESKRAPDGYVQEGTRRMSLSMKDSLTQKNQHIPNTKPLDQEVEYIQNPHLLLQKLQKLKNQPVLVPVKSKSKKNDCCTIL